MRWYWLERGLFIEAREWLECGLRAADGCTSALLARTRGALGLFTYYLCDFARARVLLHECLDGLGDDETGERAFALGLLGFIEAVAGDARLAEQHAVEALALADRLGDDWVGGFALLAAGVLKGMAGDAGGAADILERACARLQHAGEAFMLTYVRVTWGSNAISLATPIARGTRSSTVCGAPGTCATSEPQADVWKGWRTSRFRKATRDGRRD
jgi:hypothetical protein